LEGVDQLKNPVVSSGNEPAIFRFVAQCLNQLRYGVLRGILGSGRKRLNDIKRETTPSVHVVIGFVAFVLRILEVAGSILRRGLLTDDCIRLPLSLQANVRQDVALNKDKKKGFEDGKSLVLYGSGRRNIEQKASIVSG
jgi:hypothetical protein